MQSFHIRDLPPVPDLYKEKVRTRKTISVVIPALNEEPTIGPIISSIRAECMDEYPLVDECIVIDGGSTDRTRELATAAGATVHGINDLPPYDIHAAGKGCALWKSLLATSGDIIIFCDADISDYQTSFVTGLAAPLLLDSSLSFVKSFYRRPFRCNDSVEETSGGRVTEILVRPLLSAFYPELARLFQPLAGEYALRRNCAEAVHFSSGYGVEIGLILDIYRRYGLSVFAQVDMEVRHHRNRDLLSLGRMSFAIFQTLMRQLVFDGKLELREPLNDCMQSLYNGNKIVEQTFKEVLLPPMQQIRKP